MLFPIIAYSNVNFLDSLLSLAYNGWVIFYAFSSTTAGFCRLNIVGFVFQSQILTRVFLTFVRLDQSAKWIEIERKN